VFPGRNVTSERNDRRQALTLLRGGKDKALRSLGPTPTKGETAMIKEAHDLPRPPRCTNWLRCGLQLSATGPSTGVTT